MPPASHTRRYCAFISYRHADNTQEGRRWAEWLHRGLERYVVPPDLIGTPNLRGEPIRDSLYPIFRDEDELPANADLATGIRAALEVSDHLIVLCSPRSAVSPWVRKEVREFKELGRSDRILAIIIAGEPNADDPAKAREGILRDEECFCEELRFGTVGDDGTLDWTIRTEPLAADLRPGGMRAEGFVTAEAYREHLTFNSSLTPDKIVTRTEAYRQQLGHALLKVIAGLLGVPLGKLVDRDAAHRTALAEAEATRQRKIAERERQLADEARIAKTAMGKTARRLAAAVAFTLVLALLAGWLWREARQKKVEQEALLLSASYADHEAAVRAFAEHREAEGLALLERALGYAPKNTSALAASATHAFGISASKWRTRSITTCGAQVNYIAFSPDGHYLAAGIGNPAGKGETRVIEAATGREISTVEFGGPVSSVSFSFDGRYIAAASWDNTARVIEPATGKEISKVEFGDYVTSVSFSPDGRHFAAGSVDNTARVIEAATGQEISKVEFGGSVTSVMFSPDGRYLAVGGEDNTARVIEAATGKEISKVEFVAYVTSVSFSPDGRRFAAGSWDLTAQVIEATSGQEISKVEFGGPVVASVSFSPDGRYLVVGSEDKTARVIEAATGKEISKVEFGGEVTSVMFSPDGRYLAVGGEDKTARVIEAATGKEISKVEFGGEVTSVMFSPDGRYLAAGSVDKTVRVIETTAGQNISKVELGDRVNSVSFSPDGRHFAAGSWDNTARVIEAATGKEISKVEFGDYVTSVSFSSDGRHLAARSNRSTARMIEVATGKEISKVEFGDYVTSVSFSPDGRHFAAGSVDNTARVIEAATGHEISKVKFGGSVTSVSFSPDGRYLAVGGEDKTARVIEAATGKEISKVEFGGQVISVGFSPAGRHLAAGSMDNTARVIEAATGKEISKVEFGGPVNWVEFSPDNRYLVACSWDNSARVIEAATGKVISKVGFGSIATSVSFSPDGHYLAAGSDDHTVRVIDWQWTQYITGKTNLIWQAALRHQCGLQFGKDGRLQPVQASDLAADQTQIKAFLGRTPADGEQWLHSILTWAAQPPDKRTTSPWNTEPLRVAAGRWFMQASGKVFSFITDAADEAPWHPLEPVSLARLEPKPDDRFYDASQETVRPIFLASLTLKRLREADEKLYGRDTLAEYAAWSAGIMYKELHLDAEAREALAFALERTPPEKQKELLELKATLDAK